MSPVAPASRLDRPVVAVHGPDLARWPLAAALGLRSDQLPTWAGRVLTPPVQQWAIDRWDQAGGVFEFRPGDHFTRGNTRSLVVDVAGLAPGVVLEVLASLAADAADGTKAAPPATRSVVRALRDQVVGSRMEVDDALLAQIAGIVARRWRGRLAIAAADPVAEWDRDQIRLAVVKPGAPNHLLRVGQISQSWLRDLLVSLLRVRIRSIGARTAAGWVLAAVRLSRVLASRPDQGSNPAVLSTAAMDQVVAALHADPEITPAMLQDVVIALSSILSQTRALGLTDRHGLAASFTIARHHYPETRQVVREDRGFPDATFRFLLGADDLLGPRVLALARSLPGGGDFQGEVFVTALQLAASFGRRPEELCSLPAHRLRVADTGAAELLYTNFKSGRDRVWLPVDARTAVFVQDWMPRLRDRYPGTPYQALALLPAPHRNPSGTRPMSGVILGVWFRRWVTLLEQAIVLARLHHATGVPLDVLCALRCQAQAGAVLQVADAQYILPTVTAQALIDYRADVVARACGSKYAPTDPGDLPMFPDPCTPPGTQQVRGRPRTVFTPVPADRFTALGDGWLPVAAGYPSGGIPGVNLGATRINPDQLQVRLFRHTYLQHLVNLGTDIFLVQELADHTSVQTTINSYVRVQDEKLREAVDLLAAHRLNTYGSPATNGLPLASTPARDMGTNDCTNPQVLALGREGCEYDRMCFGCNHFAADPSNIPDIKTEIHTCVVTLKRLEIEDETDLKPHHVAVLKARRDGWRRMLDVLTGHLDALDPVERERVETAASIVRDFRSRIRSGGLNLGGTTTLPTAARP